MVRLAHVWSTDIGLDIWAPQVLPLIARGWEVTVICPDGPRVSGLKALGLKWLPHPVLRTIDPKTDALGLVTLTRHFRRHRFDIVHTHNAKIGILARAAAHLANIPAIVHTHHGMVYSMESPWHIRTLGALAERCVNLRVPKILVQSEEDRDTLIETGAVPREKLLVIGNGIDLSRFFPGAFSEEERRAIRSELGFRENDVVFLAAGRLVNEKGYVELFEATRRIALGLNVKLMVAGPKDQERGFGLAEDVLESAERSGVKLLGQRDDMPRLYAACDVVILPSWREGLPRVLLEAGAMGKPFVTTDARGCREVYRTLGGGRLVGLRDPDALARAMTELASSPSLRAALGAENARKAPSHYDSRAVQARVWGLYEELLQAGRRAPPPEAT